MLLDVDVAEQRAGFARPFDACIVGAGPAGITLARRLAAQGLSVALMEAGGLDASQESQEVYAGASVGVPFPDLDIARLRFLGGSSGHWNGLCRPFDAADFGPRAASPGSGWPIGRADLDPYADETVEILDIVPHNDPPQPEEEFGDFRRANYLRSAPTRFGEKFRDALADQPNLMLGLNANLVGLAVDAGGTVTGATFKGYGDGDAGFPVQARVYALCCGGIENARLLLAFGIGNGNDQVGRYFNDHLRTPESLGEVILTRTPPFEVQFYAPTEAFIAANGTLPMLLRINYRVRAPLPFGKELARSLQCTVPYADRLADAVFDDSLKCDVGGGLGDWWRSRDPEEYPWGRVVVNAESALNPDSRVTLGTETDRFGMPRARLDWQLSPIDDEGLRVTAAAFGGWLADQDIGRLQLYDYWTRPADPYERAALDESPSSFHHMCTTRMTDDPKAGVVDRNCRVHGTTNLYVGGSSVFTSPGFVNPTYTIVQLALRLGDHLGTVAAAPAATTSEPAPEPAAEPAPEPVAPAPTTP